jgi:hypothetical protein
LIYSNDTSGRRGGLCDLGPLEYDGAVIPLVDERRFGKVLPVGGPWVRDNMCALKYTGEIMFDVLNMGPSSKVTSMAAWDRRVRNIKRISKVYPMMRRISFYLEAARYWATTPHFAPAYGTRTLRGYFQKLAALDRPPSSFMKRMFGRSISIPVDV